MAGASWRLRRMRIMSFSDSMKRRKPIGRTPTSSISRTRDWLKDLRQRSERAGGADLLVLKGDSKEAGKGGKSEEDATD